MTFEPEDPDYVSKDNSITGEIWEASVNKKGQWSVCEEGGGDEICLINGDPNKDKDGERANAIAALPELLKYLENFYHEIEEPENKKDLKKLLVKAGILAGEYECHWCEKLAVNIKFDDIPYYCCIHCEKEAKEFEIREENNTNFN